MFLFFIQYVQGAEIPADTEYDRGYTIIPNLEKPIGDRCIYFKVKSSGYFFIGLMSGNSDTGPFHELSIDYFKISL